MATESYAPRYGTGAGRAAAGRRRGLAGTMVVGLLVGAGMIYVSTYGVSGLPGQRVPSASSVAGQDAEPQVGDGDPVERFVLSRSGVSSSAADLDPVLTVEFTDAFGTNTEEFVCHDDSFDGALLVLPVGSEGV